MKRQSLISRHSVWYSNQFLVLEFWIKSINLLIKITFLKTGFISRCPLEYSFQSKDSGIQTFQQGMLEILPFTANCYWTSLCIKSHSKPGESCSEWTMQNPCPCGRYILMGYRWPRGKKSHHILLQCGISARIKNKAGKEIKGNGACVILYGRKGKRLW